jgi:hypothetical protein
VAARVTTPSPGPAVPNLPPLEDFLATAHSPRLLYTDFSSSISHRLPFLNSSLEHCSIFSHISHPYNPDAFQSLLLKHSLLSDYPLLPFNLRNGFPLGHMPPIYDTAIIPNNRSILSHMADIDEYLHKELLTGRMSGPFSREEVELILRGPFQSSPLIISVQPQEPGSPDKIRICRHLSKATRLHASVNSHIRKEDFPTRFDMASKVADMVSVPYYFFYPATFSYTLYTPFCVSCEGWFPFLLPCQLRVFASWMRYPDIVSSSMHIVRFMHLACFGHRVLVYAHRVLHAPRMSLDIVSSSLHFMCPHAFESHLMCSQGCDTYSHTLIFITSSSILSSFLPRKLESAMLIVVSQITIAPPGTQACTMDIEKFHRTCPVLPSHKPWLVVQGVPGLFYIDHNHPFGAACASSNAGMIANAVVDIWEGEGIKPILKYEDDLKIFRTPSAMGPFSDGGFCYDYDRDEMLRRISSLGVPWNEEKGDGSFTSITTFIGFLWDIPQRLVSLPERKRLKFQERVRRFLNDFCHHRHPCHLLDVQKIHGSLCHVAFVYIEGRSHLSSLSNFASKFKNDDYKTLYVSSRSMIHDLQWWLDVLSSPSISRPLHPRGPLQDLGLYVDASTSWGIGIVIGDHWASFRLSPTWKIHGRDICWLETIALELLVYFLESMGLREVHLLIHSDNQGTIGAIGKGRSPNMHINLSIRRTYLVLISLFITPHLVYVESGANPADPISRGESGAADRRISPTFKLPEELINCFVDVQS